jgi:ferredoxin
MMATIFNKKDWQGALETLKKDFELLGPVKENGAIEFAPLEGAKEMEWVYSNSRLSPKSLFFPQSHTLFAFSREPGSPEAEILKEVFPQGRPRLVVGIRPCDAQAFILVDRNFITAQYVDPWWEKARKNTVLFGLGCNHPCATCFCTSAGSGPFAKSGLDVLLYDLGEKVLAEPVSPRGEELLAGLPGGKKAGKKEIQEAQGRASGAEAEIAGRVETGNLKNKDLMGLYGAPFWEAVQFACINCGTCTYLCPTCWCFDIQDEVFQDHGWRLRNWDSCMSPLFTLHGSGHNPRGDKISRVRQRFMHKLKYYVDKYQDGIQCVGCGRCVQHCPVNIDIRKVIKLMNDLA